MSVNVRLTVSVDCVPQRAWFVALLHGMSPSVLLLGSELQLV
jgi:hypothetical protein